MNNMNGYKVCGKRGGSTFIDAKRPKAMSSNDTSATLVCDDGWLPCDLQGNAEFTLCYPESGSVQNNCPVTSIEFLNGNLTDIVIGKSG